MVDERGTLHGFPRRLIGALCTHDRHLQLSVWQDELQPRKPTQELQELPDDAGGFFVQLRGLVSPMFRRVLPAMAIVGHQACDSRGEFGVVPLLAGPILFGMVPFLPQTQFADSLGRASKDGT